MNVDVLSYFTTEGPWAILFVFGLIYTIKWTREREDEMKENMEKLLETYEQLSKDLSSIHSELIKHQQNVLLNRSLIEMMQEEYAKNRKIESETLHKLTEISRNIEKIKNDT
ncbi:BhlA/UviB family holin-like peptide [Fictibacillus iocasae]|uniref:BhlA/UviB family holin-like peptide n=1 Tax=Fictibacillus iocasae TaxID=2715437 RepID=A0ABW2NPN9_9BACL